MALDKSVQVELPKHGIAYKKVSGKTYVYYVTATYRNEKGKPTCDRISIGRLDEETGKLIPNRNYYETQTSHPVSGAEVAINPAKSRKRFVSAGRPARKSTTSAEISSFRAINPSSSF